MAPASRQSTALRIAVVAGEASGDVLGAGLIEALREHYPQAQFAGIGGAGMRAAGLEAWWDCSELALMGLVEILRHLPRLLALRRALVARTLAWQPDVFIGIDAPEFNLGVERRLKSRGVRTVHYVSPSIWAWRAGRAATIGRSADRVLCLFPMEPAIYARHGVDARFVGHPLADRFELAPDRAAARSALGLASDVPVLAVLPGSRLGEIARLGSTFASAAALVAAAVPGLRVIAPMANAACRAAFEPIAQRAGHPITLLDGQAERAMIAADVVLLASGTAALEGMLAQRPMVVGYRIAPLTHWIVTTFGMMRTEYFALPNVLAGELLAPELLQSQCTPERLADAVLHWFRDPAAAAALLPRYLAIHRQLRRDASRSAAASIAQLLDGAAA